jgi:hypothetical protein
MNTHRRRVREEDGILLLGVAKDQQHQIQHHIRIEPSRSRTNRNKQQFHNTRPKSDLAPTACSAEPTEGKIKPGEERI